MSGIFSGDQSREKRTWAAIIVVCLSILAAIAIVSRGVRFTDPDWTAEAGGIGADDERALAGFVGASMKGGLDGLDAEVKRFGDHVGSAPVSDDVRLYFLQDQVEGDSMEREFLEHELKPAQEDLRKVIRYGSAAQMQTAYARLRSRVLNYELGATRPESQIGPGAKAYLSCYRNAMKGKGE